MRIIEKTEPVALPMAWDKDQDFKEMKIIRSLLIRQILCSAMSLSMVCSITPAAGAGSGHKRSATGAILAVKISRFGKVNDHYYRGSQPKSDQYQQLVAAGIKTVVDLRDDAEDYARSAAEGVGLRYINLPLNDNRYPPTDAAARFLEIVNNPANWPVYVHCAGGRHRTGAMTAVYRMTVDGWDAERAYAEMKQYDFYTRFGHGCFKDFVYDYYRDLQLQRSIRSFRRAYRSWASSPNDQYLCGESRGQQDVPARICNAYHFCYYQRAAAAKISA